MHRPARRSTRGCRSRSASARRCRSTCGCSWLGAGQERPRPRNPWFHAARPRKDAIPAPLPSTRQGLLSKMSAAASAARQRQLARGSGCVGRMPRLWNPPLGTACPRPPPAARFPLPAACRPPSDHPTSASTGAASHALPDPGCAPSHPRDADETQIFEVRFRGSRFVGFSVTTVTDNRKEA